MIQPEDFTNQLQRELNSSPQPCLVPFLKVNHLMKIIPYKLYIYIFAEKPALFKTFFDDE